MEIVGELLKLERSEPGVKVGASALRRVAEAVGEGMVMGSEPPLSLLLLLTLRDPGCELLGESVLRSEIMRCRLLSASSPWVSMCFLVAALTAASMAVTGDDVEMDNDCGWPDSCSLLGLMGIATGAGLVGAGLVSLLDEAAEVGRCGAFVDERRLIDLESFFCRVLLLSAVGFEAALPDAPLPALPPRLVPPDMVVVLVLPFFLSPPLPCFSCLPPPGVELEFERETEAEDSCERCPRRLPVLRDEADEFERDGLGRAGGASLSPDVA